MACLACLLPVSLLLAACGVWRPTPVPLRTVRLPATCADKPHVLVAFLPGVFTRPREFVANGLVALLRERHIAADALLVDAHLGYYSEHSIVERLQSDVIAPARAAGYAQVWLVGVSLGGYGALIHSAAYRHDPAGRVDGIVAIAPYPGDDRVVASIDDAGGLAKWPAPARSLPPNAFDVTLWRWLQGYATGQPRPPLYLGYGLGDRFASSSGLLAAALPASHVVTVPGGHDWPVWQAIWQRLLPALPLPVDASCVATSASR